jgi:repressor LexA
MPRIATGLTDRQSQVLGFVMDFAKTNGYPPTRKDIAQHFGWKSANAAEDHLRAIARKGYIFIGKHTARGISIA